MNSPIVVEVAFDGLQKRLDVCAARVAPLQGAKTFLERAGDNRDDGRVHGLCIAGRRSRLDELGENLHQNIEVLMSLF